MITNQQMASTNASFIPVSSSISNMGTTVNYSLIPTSTINAMQSSIPVSGNWIQSSGNLGTFATMTTPMVTGIQSSWNPMISASQFSQPSINFSTSPVISTTPVISAGQFNQLGSGWTGMTNFAPVAISGNVIAQPSVDISETSSDVVVTAYVSNVPLNNLSLNVTDNSLTISGTAWTGTNNLVINRTVALPTSIRAEAVDANLQSSGVLEIRLPKSDKISRKRTTINQESK
ncbi:Hsp20/alpha crystallin family protein [Heliobacterium chlorum]|nr:Hsp20/alpha crystallin family protein [Heliobacterium chlorum]